ncbi:hypothetical protein BDV93DRAFT_545494 [Ceratobasidium sp. AG-I]|nr:hypothetical protein BDV93DRAFT_545494 [Ceratobasidium sp. AG-I]
MSGTFAWGGLFNVLPLPGVSEMRDIVKGMIDLVKMAGYEKDQCDSLARRCDNLIAIAATCKELENITDILNQLQEMKAQFEEKLKPKSKLSKFLQSQDRLEACERLGQELTNLMEVFHFQHSISASRKWPNEALRAKKQWIEDNFTTIDAYKLSCDEEEFSTWSSQPSIVTQESGTKNYHRIPGPVVITHQLGHIGGLPVLYKSFRSESDYEAKTQMAEQQLKAVSRIRHKNVAAVVGVTKGCDGLDGFVVIMEGIPFQRFLAGLVTGNALGRCIQTIKEANRFVWGQSFLAGENYTGDNITVALDGRATVLPCRHKIASLIAFGRDVSTTVQLALLACGHPEEDTSGLIGAIMSLGQSHLTELRLFKMLKDSKFLPFDSHSFWDDCVLPTFTVRAGDFGFVEDQGKSNRRWKVLEKSGDVDETEHTIYHSNRCERKWKCQPSTHPQYRSCVADSYCEPKVVHICYCSRLESLGRWEDIMERAKMISKQHDVELDKVSYVDMASIHVNAKIPHSSKQFLFESSLYFHRNPFARSSPRDFWGFYSVSSDPCAPFTGLEGLGWTYSYSVFYRKRLIGDDWGRQYKRAIQAGLAAIPGGYPEAYISEISNDEAE